MRYKYLIKLRKIYLIKEHDGFAISQILVLGIGLAAITSGIIAATINGLTEAKISRQELMAKAASESGVTTFRALLNDNGDILYASVSNTEPLKIAGYTTLCTFLRKIENLEFETHEN